MFKKLFYKKKFIIYSLSAIFLFLICNSNVLAFNGYVSPDELVNYSYNGVNIPDVTTIPTYNSYSKIVLLRTHDINNYWWAALFNTSYDYAYLGSTNTSYCGQNDFPVAINSSCKSNNNSYRYLNTRGQNIYYVYDFYTDTWVLERSVSTSNLPFQYWYDFVYSNIDLELNFGNHHYFNKGFLVSVDNAIPSYSLFFNDYMYDSNNSLFYRYRFHINNISSDYLYQYRLMDFDSNSYLTDWIDSDIIGFNTSNPYIDFDFYNNVRLLIRIVRKSDNVVISNQSYVVAGFLDSDYKQYYFNDSDFFYYISGFHNYLPNRFFVLSNGSFSSWDLSYYDFTDNLVIDFNISTTSCNINNINYFNCFSPDFSDIPNYNPSHDYGLRIRNYHVSSLSSQTFGPGATNFNDRTFYVLSNLYVSSSGFLDISSGIVSDNDISYLDSTDTITSVDSYDFSISNFDIFVNSLNDSGFSFNHVFSFISNGFGYFFNSLVSPMSFCWIFCFSLIIIALSIKIFY